jgi:photosystem II stability/assembly factor-like uncharacterized protein
MTTIAKTFVGCIATIAIAATVGGSTAFARQAFHPDGRSVGSLAVDPKQPTVIYAGSGVGVFKTSDGGATWSNASNGLGRPVVLDVVLDPTRPRTVYVATGAGVFKSIDGADSWTMRFSRHDVVQLAVQPSNPRVLYAGAKNAVFKSRDGGATWRRVLGFHHGQWALALAIDPRAPSTVYVGTGAGVFKTSDGGAHWRSANHGLRKPSVRDRFEGFVRAIAIDPRQTRTVYLGTERGFFRSTNAGESWKTPSKDAPAAIWALAIHPRNAQILYAGFWGGVFKSTNGGKNWRNRSNGLTPPYATERPWAEAVAIDPLHPRTVYAGGSGGVFKSIDGGALWRRASPFAAPKAASLTYEPRRWRK